MSNIYILEPPTSGKVVLKTTVGDIDVELWTREAPKACRNFIQLCMEGYYDDTIFHRIVKGFIVQGGDPTGTGEGGESIYGDPFKDEFHTRLRYCRRGLMGMANAGKDDNGSQFFFTLGPTPELQNKNTIFGKVTGETLYNMLKLEEGLVEDERPIYPQKIIKTKVLNNPFEDIKPRTTPKPKLTEEKPKKKKDKGVKDFKLLSFGMEAEEDEEESGIAAKQFSGKSKSAHDNLSDPKLSTQSVIEEMEKEAIELKKQEDDENANEKKNATEKEKSDMKQRIIEKLQKQSKTPTVGKSSKISVAQEDEEPYYFGKDRDDAQKLKLQEIRKEYRDLKREIRNEKKEKSDTAEKEKEDKKKKEKASELLKEYHKTQEEFKKETSKVPKKGPSREQYTMQMLNSFKSKLQNALASENSEDETKEKEGESDDDDITGDSWMKHKLVSQENAPILAKDASTKGDDWFEIYDPRNPINKRRRGEGTGSTKGVDNKKIRP